MIARRFRRLLQSTFGLAAIVSAGLVLAIMVIGLLSYDVTHEALEEQLDQRTATETRALMAEPGADRLAAIAGAIHRREGAGGPDHLAYILVDANGRRVAGSLDARVPGKTGYREFLHYDNGRMAQSLTTDVPGGGRLVVAADRAILAETDFKLLLLFTLAFGATSLLAVAGAWIVGTVTRARLDRIDHSALAIIGGDMTRRMPIDGSGSEFDRVSMTLNRMLDRITALMDNLRQVSSDVAHDLRTPLTRLRHRLDEALASDDEETRRAAVTAAAAQAEDLLDIFAALLRISEVEALGVRRHFRPVALGSVIGDLIETYRPDIDASGRSLTADVDADATVSGDRRLLQQMASNLFDNALRHTPDGAAISVALDRLGEDLLLTVADTGPGVDQDTATRLFQRFSRAEKSRTSEGHGLGLALVQAIATAHGGQASILPGPVFAIAVRLPAKE